MVKCGYSLPKWVVYHRTSIYCVELELKKKIRQINEPCCIGEGTYKSPPQKGLNFNHPIKELIWTISPDSNVDNRTEFVENDTLRKVEYALDYLYLMEQIGITGDYNF